MGYNGILHQIFYVFNRIISSWICSYKVSNMSEFDDWVMEHYEEIWETENGEE